MANFFQQKNNNNRKKSPLRNIYWMYAIIALVLVGLYFLQEGGQTRDVDWTDFEKAAADG